MNSIGKIAAARGGALPLAGRSRLPEYYAIATWQLIGFFVLYSLAIRVYAMWDLPLWLDESWTAVISAAPDLRSLVRQLWLDSNAPLYYVLVWLWPFESNIGLKSLSMIFGIGAAALAAFWPIAGTGRQTRFVWAALLLLWQPGLAYFIDARYYALVLLLSVAQLIAFANLLHDPTRARAALWVGLCSLGILGHYLAAIPALVQGLVYLAEHRRAALRTWPAILLLAPALLWLAFHWPRLAMYADPEAAWQRPIRSVRIFKFMVWPVAQSWTAAALLAVLAAVFRVRALPDRHLLLTLAAGIGGFAAMLAVAVALPLGVDRYLLPIVPALLLALVVLTRRSGHLPIALVMGLAMGLMAQVRTERLARAETMGLEAAAARLTDARTVTWMIDFGGANLLDRTQMEMLLADAFRRNGRTVTPRWSGDLLAGDGLIWLYKPERAPLVARIKRDWRCHDLPGHPTGVLACQR